MNFHAYRACLLISLFVLAGPGYGQTDMETSVIREKFHFSSGDFRLEGNLLLPDTLKRHPAILYLWGSGPTNSQRHIRESQILEKFLSAGYAVALYDKPGSGASGGQLSEAHLLRERAEIARSAMALLRKHPHIDPGRIGLYGSSQAAYVMALLLQNQEDPAFVVCWSCPMENSIEQAAYQIREYLLCAGRDTALAEKAARSYRESQLAGDYDIYLRNAEFLNQIPEVREELGWGEILPPDVWKPIGPGSEELLDPARVFGKMQIPLLAIYGTLDKNIDPHQAVAFLSGLQRNTIKTVWIPGADHNMRVGGTGCVQEQIARYRTVPNARRSPVFEAAVVGWLELLRD